jgi:hypothetical protein
VGDRPITSGYRNDAVSMTDLYGVETPAIALRFAPDMASGVEELSTIPNDYSSTTTIPKLNFRFPERTVTMQETYADRCREGHRWGENWNG